MVRCSFAKKDCFYLSQTMFKQRYFTIVKISIESVLVLVVIQTLRRSSWVSSMEKVTFLHPNVSNCIFELKLFEETKSELRWKCRVPIFCFVTLCCFKSCCGRYSSLEKKHWSAQRRQTTVTLPCSWCSVGNH